LLDEDISGKAHKQKFYDYVNKKDLNSTIVLINGTE